MSSTPPPSTRGFIDEEDGDRRRVQRSRVEKLALIYMGANVLAALSYVAWKYVLPVVSEAPLLSAWIASLVTAVVLSFPDVWEC